PINQSFSNSRIRLLCCKNLSLFQLCCQPSLVGFFWCPESSKANSTSLNNVNPCSVSSISLVCRYSEGKFSPCFSTIGYKLVNTLINENACFWTVHLITLNK